MGLEGSWAWIYGRGTKTVFQNSEVPENGEVRTGWASLGRGNLNLLSKIMIYMANICFYFCLEYYLEYRAKLYFT